MSCFNVLPGLQRRMEYTSEKALHGPQSAWSGVGPPLLSLWGCPWGRPWGGLHQYAGARSAVKPHDYTTSLECKRITPHRVETNLWFYFFTFCQSAISSTSIYKNSIFSKYWLCIGCDITQTWLSSPWSTVGGGGGNIPFICANVQWCSSRNSVPGLLYVSISRTFVFIGRSVHRKKWTKPQQCLVCG